MTMSAADLKFIVDHLHLMLERVSLGVEAPPDAPPIVPARSFVARAGISRVGLSSPVAASPSTFGDLIRVVRDRILETLALITPGAPLVSPQGTPGTTAYGYAVVAINATGHSPASLVGATAIGPDTLSDTASNQVTWTPVRHATGYQIFRVTGGDTQGLLAQLGDVATYTDLGGVGDDADPPTTNTSGTVGQYWSDEELLAIMILGAKDLWRSFIDLHQEHFFTVNTLDVTLPKDGDRLDGLPSNIHRVLLIASNMESGRAAFEPSDYTSAAFGAALASPSRDPNGATIQYAVTGAGAPVGAPTIYTAPAVNTEIPIRLVYIPTLGSGFDLLDNNPVPGESDAALVAYTVAFALAKDREDRSPDPNWLAVYSTEKNSCLVAAAPRQEQTAPMVTGVFDDLTGPGLSGWGEDDW